MRRAAAEKKLSVKENTGNASRAGAIIPMEPKSTSDKVVQPVNDTAQTANNEESCPKRKEIPSLDKEKTTKRPRIVMAATKRKLQQKEISRVELHGAEKTV